MFINGQYSNYILYIHSVGLGVKKHQASAFATQKHVSPKLSSLDNVDNLAYHQRHSPTSPSHRPDLPVHLVGAPSAAPSPFQIQLEAVAFSVWHDVLIVSPCVASSHCSCWKATASGSYPSSHGSVASVDPCWLNKFMCRYIIWIVRICFHLLPPDRCFPNLKLLESGAWLKAPGISIPAATKLSDPTIQKKNAKVI